MYVPCNRIIKGIHTVDDISEECIVTEETKMEYLEKYQKMYFYVNDQSFNVE